MDTTLSPPIGSVNGPGASHARAGRRTAREPDPPVTAHAARAHADGLGVEWGSELQRHYR